MVNIKKNLSYNNNYYGIRNKKAYITIHETANTGLGANAQAHANFINNGSMETWHYSVDDTQAIQHFYHTTSCWHAGTYNGNTQSIGIEMCVNRDGSYMQTLQNTIELVQKIMKQEGIPLSHVVQHNYWSGKNCPTLLRQGTHGMNWKQFKGRIAGEQVVTHNKRNVPKGWKMNTINNVLYKKEKATFIVGSQPITTRLYEPFLRQVSGGKVKPKQKIKYQYVCINDGYVWIQLKNNRGLDEFVPVRTCVGKPPRHIVGKLWGEIK